MMMVKMRVRVGEPSGITSSRFKWRTTKVSEFEHEDMDGTDSYQTGVRDGDRDEDGETRVEMMTGTGKITAVAMTAGTCTARPIWAAREREREREIATATTAIAMSGENNGKDEGAQGDPSWYHVLEVRVLRTAQVSWIRTWRNGRHWFISDMALSLLGWALDPEDAKKCRNTLTRSQTVPKSFLAVSETIDCL
jgi:hypothetical protein